MKNNTRIRLFAAFFAVLFAGTSMVRGQVSTTQTAPKVKSQGKSDHKTAEKPEWTQLFNGKDLSGWTPKILGHQLGDNYADTFRVENGILKISYDKYVDADFKNKKGQDKFDKFGHLFYKDSFSNYDLRVEYRFVGNQVKKRSGLGVSKQRFDAAWARSCLNGS